MTTPNKKAIHSYCLSVIQEKIALSQSVANSAQNSANNETKSTAGDKHDTARAMAHIEQEKYARILAEQMQIEKLLLQINPEVVCNSVSLGALVKCSNGWFYFASSIGKSAVEGQTIFVVSMQSPLAQLLKGKKAGDKFTLQGKTQTIEEIF